MMLPENIFPLPTLPNLGVDPSQIPKDLDVKKIIHEWFSSFADNITSSHIDNLVDLFVPKLAYWRDILALTWNFRTFAGSEKIRTFLQDRLKVANVKNLSLTLEEYTMHAQPAPDIQWIQFFFKFEVGDVGSGLGIARLVPVLDDKTQALVWRAHLILTTLEELKGFPEKAGLYRPTDVYAGNSNWAVDRANEAAFKDKDPVVLIVGGAQSGLEVAARLKMLDVSCLVVEKGDRIGGNWINRYTSLRLHDPVWYDHMPYLPFPASWPVFSPVQKFANWLQHYAEVFELNVWTRATVEKVSRDANTGLWSVRVVSRHVDKNGRTTETERVFTVKHVVFATGLISEVPKLPIISGMDHFKGEVIHAYNFKTAADYKGKKVVVIGACTSAHDISADCYHHGVDVTMYQRSSTYVLSVENGLKTLLAGLYGEGGPPTDIADRINASFPNAMAFELSKRRSKMVADLDKDLLDGLHNRGFKTNMGYQGTGLLTLFWNKGGGYYLDTGASQLIIDGHIKLKSDSLIKELTEDGIEFEDGTSLPADVIICATGLGDIQTTMRRLLDSESVKNLSPIWGFDDEGELRGVYRSVGIPNLWCILGNLAFCRFHSKHIALQIKAIEENLFGERYD